VRSLRAALAAVLLLAASCGSDEAAGPGAPGGALPRVATLALVPSVSLAAPESPAAPADDHNARPREVVGEPGASGDAVSAAATEVAAIQQRPAGEAGPAAPSDAPTAGPASIDPAVLRPVFDLADNRLLAHWMRDGALFLAAGSPGFPRYVHIGRRDTSWQFGQRREGVPVALLSRSGVLTVPLDKDAASRPGVVAARVHSRGRARLSIAVNGATGGDLPLAGGWQTVSIPVAASRWRVGENGVRLTLRGAGDLALAWVRVGGSEAAARAGAGEREASDPDRLLSFYDPADRAIRLGAREQLVYYLYLPEGAVLGATVTGEGGAAGCRIGVQVRADQAALDGELSAVSPRIDLDAMAGQIARVRFEAVGCEAARMQGASVQVAMAAPAVRQGPAPRHVILWVMDTLRADRIRPIRPGARPEVPALERLAAEGAVFRQAYVQGNESQTSHASMWTSVYPAQHNVRTAGNGGTFHLGDRFATLGETARKAGLYTTGVTANGMITKGGGYARGFQTFVNMMREGHPGRTNGAIPGDRILTRALGTLKGREKDPFLLFIGTIDTHKPWIGHEPWLSRYSPGKYKGPFLRAAHAGDLGIKRGSMRCTRTPSERDLARIHAIYDSDVSYQDSVLGKMLDKLDAWGIADDTMIIVTADHGEELWEDGRCGHGASLRDTLLHVPLFVRYPPLIAPGTVVEEGVDVLDVLPTLTDALGLDPPSPTQGTSLLPLARGAGRGYPRPSYASQYEYAHALRIANWKISISRKDALELFDLGNDPGENATVGNRPVEARYMIDALRLFLANRARWKRTEWGVVNNMTAAAPEGLARPAPVVRVSRPRAK
jgi:arylsulfatase A-like enzyme